MSNLNTREEKLKLVFAAHPNAKEIFMTSDDRAFFDAHNAEAYAQGLKDQEVKRYEKTEDGRPETDASTSSATDGADEDAGAGDASTSSATDGAGDDAGAGDASTSSATDGADEDAGAGVASTGSATDGADESGDDRAALVARYEELIGKKPNNFMKLETIKAKIAEAEAK